MSTQANYTISPMTSALAAQLPALIQGLSFFREWGADGVATRDAILNASPQDHISAAIDPAQNLLGFSWVMPKGAFGRSAYLKLLAIRDDQRGLGLGRALMSHNEALHLHPHGLCLLVTATNTPARRFYERLGYNQVGLLPSYVKPGIDECLYLKR